MEMPCTYIKKAFCQISKSKTDTISLQSLTTLQPALAQVDISCVKKLVGTCFDTLYPDTSTTTKDKVEKIRALHNKWFYEDIKEVVGDVKLAA